MRTEPLRAPERIAVGIDALGHHGCISLDASNTTCRNPRDARKVLHRKLNTPLKHVQIPKIEPKLLGKKIGKDRTPEQVKRSEKRAVWLGLHSFRRANATAMDSRAIHDQIRKQRLGQSAKVTENYAHTFTQDERDTAEKLGDFFGTGWAVIDKGRVISFRSLSLI
jgi:hypothetical protein